LVGRYIPGHQQPDGNTEFNFSVANFNFHSVSYDWLVVAGRRAQYRGTGTVNNTGSYGFTLTAIDGDVPGGGGLDKFRMKVWDLNNNNSLVYDNQVGSSDYSDPTTVISGGSITIHP
jgi:hypothetical protein